MNTDQDRINVRPNATSASRPVADALSADQLMGFRRDGYIVLPNFLSANEVRALLDDLENLTSTLDGKMPPNTSVAWEKDAGDGTRIAHQVLNVHLLSNRVRDVVNSEQLRRVGQTLLCEDLALAHSKFILKEKRKGTEIPWHQDMPYWLGEYSAGFLTCMIYLSDADSDNGCLEVLPGSHRAGLRPFEQSEETRFGIRASNLASSNAVNVEGRAGPAVIFGPFLMHRSGPNSSDRHRRSISIVLSSSWNVHIARLDDTEPRLGKAVLEDVVERRKIGRVTGPGSHNGAWAPYYRRRALRRLAKDCVADPNRPWLEVTDAFCEEDSFAWFLSRKPAQARFLRVQKYPLVRSTRPDVGVFTGEVDEQLTDLAKKDPKPTAAGVIAFDFATDKALSDALFAVKPWLAAGTILFIDRFFAPARKSGSRARTLELFARTIGARLQYVARADFSVVVRIEELGARGKVEFGTIDWQTKDVGIAFEREKLSQFAMEGLKASRLMSGARRFFGPAWQGVRVSVQEIRGRVRRA